jgi:SAM-dependent methyltransferase
MRKIPTAGLGVVVAVLATAAFAQPVHEDLDTPFVITPTNVVDAMLDLANVAPGDRLIDLGSGDGRIVLAAARRGAIAVGIEIDTYLVERSRESARRLKLEDRATFVKQDLFETDFGGYDVVTLYLLPDVNKRLAPKFLATLKPGTRIVSHDYGLGDWPPDRTIVVDAPDKPVNVEKKSTIHYWRVPARVEGRWRGEAAGEPLALDLEQRYQKISGTLRFSGRDYPFIDQRLDGDRLSLALGGPVVSVELRLSGDRLVGELRQSGKRIVANLARR